MLEQTLHRISRVLQISQTLALLAVFATGAILWQSLNEFQRADASVDHTYQVLNEISHTRTSILRGGLALRNYSIAPKEEFLERLEAASVDAGRSVSSLERLVSDNLTQQLRAQEVASEAAEIIGWYRSSSVIARRDGVESLLSSMRKRVSADASLHLRQLLDVMTLEEQRLLAERRAMRNDGFTAIKRSLAAGAGLFVIFMLGCIAYSSRLVGSGQTDLRALEASSDCDPLTGLANRRALQRHVLQLHGKAMALITLDLDDFKPVNDTFGHAAGDHVLRVVGQRLLQQLRGDDTVARTGGDEFLIVMPGIADLGQLAAIAARVRSSIAMPIIHGLHELHVGASVGFACTEGSLEFEALAEAADTMAYAEKRRGKMERRQIDNYFAVPPER